MLGRALQTLAGEPATAPYVADLFTRGNAAVLLNADPPDHVRQRKAVNRAFRPGRLRAMEPLIGNVASTLIAAFASRGEVELVGQFAIPLPMTIIAAALGVPDDDLATFKRWSDDLVMPIGNPEPTLDQVRGYVVSNKQFADYFRAVLADRRRQPADDIISDVANAEVDGQPLEVEEQLGMLTQFLVAGNETTTKLLTNIAFHLATDPDLQERVRADRALVEGLVEEVLRLEAPVGGLFRRATTDVELGGQLIPAGDHVWVVYAAANRDGERFAEPDTLDPCRADARDHLAFGHGEHYCIGAGLARAEARIGTNLMLDALADLRLHPAHREEFEDTFVLRGRRHLDLTFRPTLH